MNADGGAPLIFPISVIIIIEKIGSADNNQPHSPHPHPSPPFSTHPPINAPPCHLAIAIQDKFRLSNWLDRSCNIAEWGGGQAANTPIKLCWYFADLDNSVGGQTNMKCNIREQCICGQHRKFHLVIPIGSSLFVMRSDHNDYHQPPSSIFLQPNLGKIGPIKDSISLVD